MRWTQNRWPLCERDSFLIEHEISFHHFDRRKTIYNCTNKYKFFGQSSQLCSSLSIWLYSTSRERESKRRNKTTDGKSNSITHTEWTINVPIQLFVRQVWNNVHQLMRVWHRFGECQKILSGIDKSRMLLYILLI